MEISVTKPSTAGSLESNDVLVSILPCAGYLKLIIQSIVQNQFGEEIERVVRETLSHLGLTEAEVMVQDRGAVEFVLRARVKTAVLRATEREI